MLLCPGWRDPSAAETTPSTPGGQLRVPAAGPPAPAQLASAYRCLGRHRDAARQANDALLISRSQRDEYNEAAALQALGLALAGLGDLGRARSCLAGALALASKLGIPEAKQIALDLAGLTDASGTPPSTPSPARPAAE